MRTRLPSVVALAAITLAGCLSLSPNPTPTAADRHLAEELEAAIEFAWGTPANEIANMITYESDLIPILKGEVDSTPEQLDFARRQGTNVTAVCQGAAAWPKPPRFRLPYAQSALTIDGKTDEAAWQNAAVFRTLYPFNKSEPASEPATTFRVLWNEEYMFFAFECADTDVQAKDVERDGPVWEWDCVEVFLLPEFEAGQYWEIDVTPAGSIYDALNAKNFRGWGPLARPELSLKGLQTACAVDGTINNSDDVDGGYTIEIAVPFSQIPSYTRGNAPQPGDTLQMMLIRIDRNAAVNTPYAFTPLHNWGHNIWNHAQAELTR